MVICGYLVGSSGHGQGATLRRPGGHASAAELGSPLSQRHTQGEGDGETVNIVMPIAKDTKKAI